MKNRKWMERRIKSKENGKEEKIERNFSMTRGKFMWPLTSQQEN